MQQTPGVRCWQRVTMYYAVRGYSVWVGLRNRVWR
jgi:hypothetical protein